MLLLLLSLLQTLLSIGAAVAQDSLHVPFPTWTQRQRERQCPVDSNEAFWNSALLVHKRTIATMNQHLILMPKRRSNDGEMVPNRLVLEDSIAEEIRASQSIHNAPLEHFHDYLPFWANKDEYDEEYYNNNYENEEYEFGNNKKNNTKSQTTEATLQLPRLPLRLQSHPDLGIVPNRVRSSSSDKKQQSRKNASVSKRQQRSWSSVWKSLSSRSEQWIPPPKDSEWLGIGTNSQEIVNITIRPAPTVDDDEYDILGRKIFRRYHLETIHENHERGTEKKEEDSLLLFSDVVEGAHLVRVHFVHRKSKKHNGDEWDRLEWYQSPQSQFLVNDDNTLSPVSQPDLVVALSLPTVELVHRNSPHRLQFRHANLTQTLQSVIPMEITTSSSRGNPSQPRLGLTVVSSSPFGPSSSSSMRIGNGAQMQHVYLGEHDPDNHHTLLEMEVMDNQKHLEFNLFVRTTTKMSPATSSSTSNDPHNHHHATMDQTMFLTPWNMELTLGNRVVLMGYNEEKEENGNSNRGTSKSVIARKLLHTSLRKSSQSTWKFNWEDGTLSPVDAPHLVLGCQSIRIRSSSLSKTQQQTAISISQSNIHTISNASNPILNTTTTSSSQQSILLSNHSIPSSPSSPSSLRQLESIVMGILLVEETYPISIIAICLIFILLIIKMLPTAFWITLVATITWGPEAAVYWLVLQILGQILWDWIFREFFYSKMKQPKAMQNPKEEKQDE
jgi:hypothetical protein